MAKVSNLKGNENRFAASGDWKRTLGAPALLLLSKLHIFAARRGILQNFTNMLQTATLQFLEQLAENNNKTWFDAHRDQYQAARTDFEAFADRLRENLTALEPALAELKAKDCVFRIFRDVRFSKDKTPYKSHFGAFLSRGGRKFPGAGYYIHIEANGKSFAGGGLWQPEPALLKKVRQEIDYNFEEFQTILKGKPFRKHFAKLEGESLKNLPQGYAPDNPAADYLRMKSFTVGREFSNKDVTSKGFLSISTDVFRAMEPLVNFLNRALD